MTEMREFYVYQDERWREQAACKGKPTSWWYPDKGHSPNTAKARAICQTCPVVNECLKHALDRVEEGIWGNTNIKTRRRLRELAPSYKHLVCQTCRRVFLRPSHGAAGYRPYCSPDCKRQDKSRRVIQARSTR